MLSQEQADRLIEMLKRAARRDIFVWQTDQRHDELVTAVEDAGIEFVLFLRKNRHEIRLHFRTKDRNIGLARIDAAPYHCNPDGTELRNTPHLHYYREGHALDYARAIDWYDVTDPLGTLDRFLDHIRAEFPFGKQLELF